MKTKTVELKNGSTIILGQTSDDDLVGVDANHFVVEVVRMAEHMKQIGMEKMRITIPVYTDKDTV